MIKLKKGIYLVLLIGFLTLVTCISFIPKNGNAEINNVELSEDDRDVLKYYQEPTIDMKFEDNEVCVILKSSYNYLNEIHFNYFKEIDAVSKIIFADLYTEKYQYNECGVFPLGSSKHNHMFNLVFATHSKEMVLSVINLIKKLDMVLIAEPEYIYEISDDWKPNDKDYYDQWGLNGANGINVEQASRQARN